MIGSVQDHQKDTVRDVLLKSFKAQETTPFIKPSFDNFRSELIAVIKDEFVAEVNDAMDHFASYAISK